MTRTRLDTSHYIVFTLDGLFYAISLSAVSRVIRAVEITPLPKAPSIVLGVINLGGRIIPVVNIRKRFLLPERELELTDQLIVACASRSDGEADRGRLLALMVDEVVGVRDLSPQETVAAETILSGLEHLEGVAKTDQGLILIHDLGTFLSLEEESALGAILPEGTQ
ncbi:MAG: chemotaxis protein CheW [Spirochaetia bacterium]|jgi:purine-binding chemotaxis protein CheW